METCNRNIVYLLSFFFVLCCVQTTEAKSHVTILKTSFVCTEHYADNCSSTFVKLDNGSYSYSMYANILKPLYENVTIFLRTYEMKNGVYKKSLLNFDKNFCDFVKSDFFMLKMIKGYTNLPNKCPVPVGPMYVKDYVSKDAQFPPGMSDSQWKFVFGMRSGDLELNDIEVEIKLENK